MPLFQNQNFTAVSSRNDPGPSSPLEKTLFPKGHEIVIPCSQKSRFDFLVAYNKNQGRKSGVKIRAGGCS